MSANHTKKVLILGATGPTGILTVREALDHGHSVTIYARNPQKIPSDILESPALKEMQVFQGELTDAERLSEAIRGQDVIVSLLGPTANVTDSSFADAYRLVFPLMKESNVKRILAMGTPSISDPRDGFSILAFLGVLLIRIIANSAYKDIVSVGKLFDTEATANGLDWTLFRLGFLGNGPPRVCKAGHVGQKGWAMKNQRADVAAWLVGEIEKDNSEWNRKRPSLWS